MSHREVQFVPGWERPVRIPEGVPLERAEPPFAIAGEKSTWRLPFRLGSDVPPDAVLKLQLFARRNNRIEFGAPQVDRPESDDYLTIRASDGKLLPARPDGHAGTFIITPPEEGLEAGSRLVVSLGDKSRGGGGTKAPSTRLLNKFFLLYLVDDEGEHLGTWLPREGKCIVAACTVHVLGGAVDHLRAYAPSRVRPGEPFEVLVRPEDEFSNLSHQALDDVLVFADGEAVKTEISRVAESTCLRVRVRLPEEGVCRIRLCDPESGKEAVANPLMCRKEAPPFRTYWGMIHGHTEMSDGAGSIDYYFRQMRDEAALDFAAPGDHDHLHETDDEMWRMTCEAVAGWNSPGEFVAFLGYEWAKWRRNGDGDRNVYYLHDHRPMYRSDVENYPTPPDLFRALRDEHAIIIPHHPAHGGNFCDWKDHDPERERLVEIFQIRGSYETSAEEGNHLPERYDDPPFAGGYVSRALAMGWRVGFTGGGDDHCAHSGTEFPISCGRAKYKAGLTGVLATERTREAIWDAMWQRRVIATTGPRIVLTYELDGRPMGSELDVAASPGLSRKRRLRIEFHGTAPAERVDVVRNNEVVQSFRGPGLDAELSWEDATPLADVLLPPAKFRANPFSFYYVRVLQEDGEMAWASPVWIDGAP